MKPLKTKHKVRITYFIPTGYKVPFEETHAFIWRLGQAVVEYDSRYEAEEQIGFINKKHTYLAEYIGKEMPNEARQRYPKRPGNG